MNDPSPMMTKESPRLPPKILRPLAFWWLGLLLGLVIGLAAFTLFTATQRRVQVSPATYVGTPLNELAANFQLTNQQGAAVSLADWQGQVVVLTFFDSQCDDTCPITAAELRAANQALGEDGQSVVFVGINVNAQANQVADVAATTRQWRLDEIPSWHFLTGSVDELQPVWQTYDVAVLPDDAGGSGLVHTPGVYVIDQTGYKRWYVSVPTGETEGASEFIPLRDLLVQHIQSLLSR